MMFDWLVGVAHAAGNAAAPAAPAGPGGMNQTTFLVLSIAAMGGFYYFLIHMPQKKRQKEREDLLAGMKRGDEVLTAGGIYGKITGVADQSVNLEISPKVRIKVTKSSITQVVAASQGEEETKE
jgi:preprotein translocase subunit YajC